MEGECGRDGCCSYVDKNFKRLIALRGPGSLYRYFVWLDV